MCLPYLPPPYIRVNLIYIILLHQAVSAFINQCESSFAKTVNDYVKRVLSKLAEQSDDDE